MQAYTVTLYKWEITVASRLYLLLSFLGRTSSVGSNQQYLFCVFLLLLNYKTASQFLDLKHLVLVCEQGTSSQVYLEM